MSWFGAMAQQQRLRPNTVMTLRTLIHSVFLLIAALLVCACGDRQAAFDAMLPKEEVKIAEQVLLETRNGDAAAIKQRMDPEFVDANFEAAMANVFTLIPKGAFIGSKVVGSITNTFNGDVTTYNLTFEQEFADGRILGSVQLRKKDGVTRLIGMTVQPQAASLEELNRFTLEGKGVLHWVVLVLMVLVPLFIVFTLVLCWRTPMVKRKWLWMLFIALGVSQLTLNWSTGAYGYQLLHVMLLGAGFLKAGPYAPWLFSVGFPLGAVVFLMRRRSLIAKANAAREATVEQSQTLS